MTKISREAFHFFDSLEVDQKQYLIDLCNCTFQTFSEHDFAKSHSFLLSDEVFPHVFKTCIMTALIVYANKGD